MIFHELPIRTDAFDWDEYQAAKRVVKEGKTFGEDGIPPEVIRRCNIDDILEFCNEALLNRKRPNQWSILNMIPVPKSGDLSVTSNNIQSATEQYHSSFFPRTIKCWNLLPSSLVQIATHTSFQSSLWTLINDGQVVVSTPRDADIRTRIGSCRPSQQQQPIVIF